jgi:hypothetical protein
VEAQKRDIPLAQLSVNGIYTRYHIDTDLLNNGPPAGMALTSQLIRLHLWRRMPSSHLFIVYEQVVIGVKMLMNSFHLVHRKY